MAIYSAPITCPKCGGNRFTSEQQINTEADFIAAKPHCTGCNNVLSDNEVKKKYEAARRNSLRVITGKLNG